MNILLFPMDGINAILMSIKLEKSGFNAIKKARKYGLYKIIHMITLQLPQTFPSCPLF